MFNISKNGLEHKEEPIKVIKVQFLCYAEKVPAVVAEHTGKYILRDKKSNKEIVGWRFEGRNMGQSVNVSRNQEMLDGFDKFIEDALNDKRLGVAIFDRDSEKVGILVTGFFISDKDNKINLMDPVFAC